MMMENDLMEAPEEEEEFDLMNDETFGDVDAGLWEVMNTRTHTHRVATHLENRVIREKSEKDVFMEKSKKLMKNCQI